MEAAFDPLVHPLLSTECLGGIKVVKLEIWKTNPATKTRSSGVCCSASAAFRNAGHVHSLPMGSTINTFAICSECLGVMNIKLLLDAIFRIINLECYF
jgi:hypothetical protein